MSSAVEMSFGCDKHQQEARDPAPITGPPVMAVNGHNVAPITSHLQQRKLYTITMEHESNLVSCKGHIFCLGYT